MPTVEDDYNVYSAAKAALPGLKTAVTVATAALDAGEALVASTAAQVSADLQADGDAYVGPDPTTNHVIFLQYSADPNATDPGFNAEDVGPASSEAGGVPIPTPPAPPTPPAGS